jgi:membrane protein YdbS with pleckstrin-like domain
LDEHSLALNDSGASARQLPVAVKSKLETSEGAHMTPLLKRAAPKRMLYARLAILCLMVLSLVLFPICYVLRKDPVWRSIAAIVEYVFVASVLLFHLTFTMDFWRLDIDVSIRVKDI